STESVQKYLYFLTVYTVYLPLVGRKPFLAAWNAPLDMCTLKHNINVSLELFHIRGSPRAVHTGQNVTIFYANRLGYYPFYNEQGVPINGGLPQNSSLEAHLHKARKDIAHFIPSEDFRGLAVIDWEFWRPQWNRNWHKKDIYRQRSRELIAQAYLNVTEEQVEELARLRFEKSAMEFMQGTLKLGTQTRPHGLWGFYLYPDCHNYNVHAHNYSGTCPLQESQRNDQLFWLWNSSTAFFPALAIRKDHMDSICNLHFSQNRVLESLRLASLTSLPYELPTFVYTRLGYRDEIDLVSSIGESAALGASGAVLWGASADYKDKTSYEALSAYLSDTLNPYIANVTSAAQLCSKNLCQGNGHCVRKNYNSDDYLHISSESHQISRKDGKYVVTGTPSPSDLTYWKNKFTCQCYEVRKCTAMIPSF
uniref:Hyaluronidase n=1 Tax=Sinocyclocheilus anshuiensis TaxID=1608454 RepID=A0A671NJE0_9TELE